MGHGQCWQRYKHSISVLALCVCTDSNLATVALLLHSSCRLLNHSRPATACSMAAQTEHSGWLWSSFSIPHTRHCSGLSTPSTWLPILMIIFVRTDADADG